MHLLEADPRHPSLVVKKIKTSTRLFEARYARGNRMSFEWAEGAILLRTNCRHEEVLKSP